MTTTFTSGTPGGVLTWTNTTYPSIREAVTRSIVDAAQRGDRLAFTSAAARFGSLDEAHKLVREQAVLRMCDRVVAPAAAPTVRLPAIAVRSAGGEPDDDGGTMYGHFTVWDSWYEIDSYFEGHFMERTVRGSTKKTLREGRASIRSLFQHGYDPIAGDKPLGPVEDLREDDFGAYYEVPLLRDDSGAFVDYVASIVPGIRNSLYGASFRFRVLREDFDYEAEPAEHNPKGLPERTLREIQVMEFGPVTQMRAATGRRDAPNEDDAETTDRTPEGAAVGSHLAREEREEPEPVRATTPTADYLNPKEVPSWKL
jgi:HK97 family phage prohead protease